MYGLEPPHDWQNPEWHVSERVHNWRNYASSEIKESWSDMPDDHKQIISAMIQE